jgi:hypothetical protein
MIEEALDNGLTNLNDKLVSNQLNLLILVWLMLGTFSFMELLFFSFLISICYAGADGTLGQAHDKRNNLAL